MKTLLVISQVYVPDPAAVGQHLHDAAAEMVRRGHRVRVITSSQGYDDPSVRYTERETRDGVEIIRVGLSSFGKGTITSRVTGGLAYLAQAGLKGLMARDISGVLVSTSPPMAPSAALLIKALKKIPIFFWAMDINPDQAVVTGKFDKSSPAVRALDWMNQLLLRQARLVVALDRFMAARLNEKCDVRDKIEIIPPWPIVEDDRPPIPQRENRFRNEHGLVGKFVIMYSGNFSIVHPLTTVLQAALELQKDPDIRFLFVGGGGGAAEIKSFIENHQPKNIQLLPYQPLDALHLSLSAADIHLVSMGNNMVGIVHPCKVYGAMAVGRPILFLGPDPSHVSDLINKYKIGWRVSHGDVSSVVRTIVQARASGFENLAAFGERAKEALRLHLGRSILRTRFCDELEKRL